MKKENQMKTWNSKGYTEKNQICKCGHKKGTHAGVYGNCLHSAENKSIDVDLFCSCKKFEAQGENFDFFEQQQIIHGETSPQEIIIERNKPKNHSPEGKIVSIDNSSDTYTGLSKNSGTLSDKIVTDISIKTFIDKPDEQVFKYWIEDKDIREFIKELNELPMEIMEAHQIKEVISKLAGKDLI